MKPRQRNKLIYLYSWECHYPAEKISKMFGLTPAYVRRIIKLMTPSYPHWARTFTLTNVV